MANKSYKKYCKKCLSFKIKKDGKMRWKQRYKCKICGHVFQNKRRRNKIEINKLWKEYSFWKQFYEELARKYKVSIQTIQNRLDKYKYIPPQVKPTAIILLIDTSYFWSFWIMVFKESKTKKVINYKIVNNENNESYKQWVKELQKQWWIIKAIVCDWRRWLLTWFPNIPTQMCQFHQKAILRRYITKNPVLEANKDLKKIWDILTCTDKD